MPPEATTNPKTGADTDSAGPLPEPPLSNYRMTIRYDGRDYLGWQRNGDQKTLQRAFEQAITAAFGVHQPVRAAGRTDRGVHADGQVVSVLLPSGLAPAEARGALNRVLPGDIEVRSLAATDGDFHARMSAIGKQYRYVIWNRATCPAQHIGRVWHVPAPLDVAAMRRACAVLVGEHDFASFAKKPNFKRSSTIRRIDRLDLEEQSPRIVLRVRGNSFLYKMVRNLVRAIVKVGEGRTTVADLRAALAARDRRAAPGTAPATGLILEAVYYPGESDSLIPDRGDD